MGKLAVNVCRINLLMFIATGPSNCNFIDEDNLFVLLRFAAVNA